MCGCLASQAYAQPNLGTDYDSCVYNFLQRQQTCFRYAAEHHKSDDECRGAIVRTNYQACFRRWAENDQERSLESLGQFVPPDHDIRGAREPKKTDELAPENDLGTFSNDGLAGGQDDQDSSAGEPARPQK